MNVVAVVILMAVVGAALFGAWRLTGSDFLIRDCSFDSDAWNTAQQVDAPDDRYEAIEPMAHDLVKCEDLLYGKEEAEAQALIGAPDSTARGGRFQFYDVGVPRSLSDYPGLKIEFGPDRRIKSLAIPGYFEP